VRENNISQQFRENESPRYYEFYGGNSTTRRIYGQQLFACKTTERSLQRINVNVGFSRQCCGGGGEGVAGESLDLFFIYLF